MWNRGRTGTELLIEAQQEFVVREARKRDLYYFMEDFKRKYPALYAKYGDEIYNVI